MTTRVLALASAAVAAVVAAAQLPGCVSTDYSGTTAAPTTHVDVFYSDAAVTRSHAVMGTAHTTASEAMPLSSVEMALVHEAQRRGADAIVIDAVDLETIGYRADPAGGRPQYVSAADGTPADGRAVRERRVSARLLKYTG